MAEVLSLRKKGFGLDLSDRSFKVAKLKKRGNAFSLSSFGDFPLPSGLLKEGEILKEEELATEIREGLAGVKGEPLRTKQVMASLPEEKAFLQVIQLPLMKKKDLEQAVRFEAEKYIPVPREKVYLDYQTVKPVVDNLDHRDVLISAMPKTVTDSYFSLFKKAGLKPVAFEIESQSIARAVIEAGKTEKRVLIIDIGARRTRFIVYAGYTLRFISSSLVSSSTFSQALSNQFDISSSEAENLKKRYGMEETVKITFPDGEEEKEVEKSVVFQALVPALTDLLEQIENCLDYYGTHARHEHLPGSKGRIGKVILCGGGANLKALEEFLADALGLPVVQADPWVNILSPGGKPPMEKEKSLKYASALGLALRAVQP